MCGKHAITIIIIFEIVEQLSYQLQNERTFARGAILDIQNISQNQKSKSIGLQKYYAYMLLVIYYVYTGTENISNNLQKIFFVLFSPLFDNRCDDGKFIYTNTSHITWLRFLRFHKSLPADEDRRQCLELYRYYILDNILY